MKYTTVLDTMSSHLTPPPMVFTLQLVVTISILSYVLGYIAGVYLDGRLPTHYHYQGAPVRPLLFVSAKLTEMRSNLHVTYV